MMYTANVICTPEIARGMSSLKASSCMKQFGCIKLYLIYLPTSPIPPLLLAQTLSSKRIAPTHSMRLKLDDTKKCQLVVKGLMFNNNQSI